MTRGLSVSVLLVTHNRAEALRVGLDALTTQSIDRSSFEVVVVDDGPAPDTRGVAESFRTTLRLRYAPQRNAGLASAWNHALSLALAPVVLFLNDETVLLPDTLEAHRRAHEANPGLGIAVSGAGSLSREDARSPLMQFLAAGGGIQNGRDFVQPRRIDLTALWPGRWSAKRAFLMRRGVFNPVFRACEDIELGHRLSQHGFQLIADHGARWSTNRTLEFDELCVRAHRIGQSMWTLVATHGPSAFGHGTDLDEIEKRWQALESGFDRVLQAGQDLHNLAVARLAAGLALDRATSMLLRHCYGRAFTACRVKGSFDASRTERHG